MTEYTSWCTNDQNHSAAKGIARKLSLPGNEICTTNYILDEVLTHLLMHGGFQMALQFGQEVFRQEAVEILYILHESERDAWLVFQKYNRDKRWSFTDCTSFVACKKLDADAVFTFDRRDFSQMGFVIL